MCGIVPHMKLPHFHHGKHERGKPPPPVTDDQGEPQMPAELQDEEGQEDHEQRAGGPDVPGGFPPAVQNEEDEQ